MSQNAKSWGFFALLLASVALAQSGHPLLAVTLWVVVGGGYAASDWYLNVYRPYLRVQHTGAFIVFNVPSHRRPPRAPDHSDGAWPYNLRLGCPDYGYNAFGYGSRGGMNINVTCLRCTSRFNMIDPHQPLLGDVGGYAERIHGV